VTRVADGSVPSSFLIVRTLLWRLSVAYFVSVWPMSVGT
jgi:hypothetical protein